MNQDLKRLWPDAERILDDVLEVPEPERSARARAACRGDAALEAFVRDLLRADATAGGFLDRLRSRLFDDDKNDTGPLPFSDVTGAAVPVRVGPFRVVREIGRGGMGTVLLGRRDDGQFEQQVAIKIFNHDIAPAAAREVLVRERRILAQLEHPNIARMYDGGVTDQGDPYFVMEFVDGRPIDEHCKAARLGIEARLRLFRSVCRAVQYAHERFVVHCDLKPRNILVTATGEVKVVDFGIARRLEEEGHGLSRGETPPLTPAYAAPEQVRGDPVTVATDVFQLGLVLYELLTERRARAAGSAPDGEPHDDASRLGKDLEAIVATALRPDPGARYPTVEALRRDIDDFLGSRPVSARGGSAAYRIGKYVRRHRIGVTAAAAVVVSLLGGMIGVAAQARVAAQERDRARLAESRASAVNDFVLQELLRAPMPESSMGRDLTVAEVLGNASRSVGHAFEGQPATEAEVRIALARTYAALGRADDAAIHARAAYDVLAAHPEASQVALEQAERTLAEMAVAAGHYDQALVTLERLRDRQRAARDPFDPELLATEAVIGHALIGLGEYAQAEALLRETSARARAAHPELWRLSVDVDRQLTRSLLFQNDGVEGEATARAVLVSLEARLGVDHPDRVTALGLLANSLTTQLRYADAAAVTEETLTSSRRIFGSNHPATADALYTHALACERLGRFDGADAAMRESFEIRGRALGPEHPATLRSLLGLGVLAANAGRAAEAEPLEREVVLRSAKVLGEAHPETVRAMRSLNQCLLDRGKVDDARDVARRLIRALEGAVAAPDADPQTVQTLAEILLDGEPADVQAPAQALVLAERAVASTGRRRYAPMRVLGDALARAGRHDLAVATMREALALPDGMRSWSTELRVVELLGEHGTPADVESFLLDRLDQQARHAGTNARMPAKTMRLLAVHHQEQKRPAEAERYFRESLDLLRRTVPEGNWEIGRAASELGGCLAARGAFVEAEPLLIDGYTILDEDGHSARHAGAARERLVKLYEAWGKPGEARRWRAGD